MVASVWEQTSTAENAIDCPTTNEHTLTLEQPLELA
jgi:hypothetical protein